MRTPGRLLSVVLAVAAVLALAACGTAKGKAADSPGTSVAIRALALTVPPGFSRHDIRGGIYRTGTRPPVIGVDVTNYRPKPNRLHLSCGVFCTWGGRSEQPPANRVALELGLWLALGPPPPARLHLPLSLDQPWFLEHPRHGTRRYRYGFFSFHGQLYDVFFWSGRAAPPHDRAAVLKALSSIRPTR